MINKKTLDPETLRSLYWKKNMSIPEIGKQYDLNAATIHKRMKKHGIPRRSLSESNYIVNKDKPRFYPKNDLTHDEEMLKIAGLMLYCSEGTFEGKSLDFANSDPEIVELFLKFLRNICGINENRLRVYLYAFSNQEIEKLKGFWSNATGIPLNQFTKPYVRDNRTDNNRMPYGLVKIRYSDKKLLVLLRNWLDNYKNSLLKIEWVGGRVVNGSRL